MKNQRKKKEQEQKEEKKELEQKEEKKKEQEQNENQEDKQEENKDQDKIQEEKVLTEEESKKQQEEKAKQEEELKLKQEAKQKENEKNKQRLIDIDTEKSSIQQQTITLNEDLTILQLSKSQLYKNFSQFIRSREINELWLIVSELLGLTNTQLFKNNPNNSLCLKLMPIIESFFTTFKILIDFETDNEQQQLQSQSSSKAISFQKTQASQQAVGMKKVLSNEIGKLTFTKGQSTNQSQFNYKSIKQLLDGNSLDTNEMFTFMSEQNKILINYMIKQNMSLINDVFLEVIKKMPKILNFENKRTYFKDQLKKIKTAHHYYAPSLRLKIRRNEIFLDSYQQLKGFKATEMKGKLKIEFQGEEGMDVGGLTREWFLQLSKEVFNANYSLFIPTSNGVTFQPSPNSSINGDHLHFFKFIGRVVGKALYDEFLLDAFFTRSFYKHMLGQPLSVYDMEDIDPEYFKNLTWILENDISQLGLNFSIDVDNFGLTKTVDLIPNGSNTPVTEINKKQYIQEICWHKMYIDIKHQIEWFLEGFHELIPKNLISIFDSRELELMISGLPEIDLDDLKHNAEYHGYTNESQEIKWLWQILEGFDSQERAAFVQFVTGTSKVPLEGFKAIRGMGNQIQKFQIHKSYEVKKLPTSHTCFNQLDLPQYPTKEIMLDKLKFAVKEGKEGFGAV
eukprot:TRINITY_DN2178_c0_g1_i2.p1 TRINITY_DN2178_c0_g1~~TRINITY_DN2178_c0_g1_i2.p1  ORF type:complete len:678 (+),score=133.34 TRINITY_DN2178_c0_g1_i2:1511-3544(+)